MPRASASGWKRPALALGALVLVGVVAATTLALALPRPTNDASGDDRADLAAPGTAPAPAGSMPPMSMSGGEEMSAESAVTYDQLPPATDHASVCLRGSVISLIAENSPVWLSEADCTARGGRVMPLAGDKMMHLWIGPGYTDAPIFAHDNPKLYNGFLPKRDT